MELTAIKAQTIQPSAFIVTAAPQVVNGRSCGRFTSYKLSRFPLLENREKWDTPQFSRVRIADIERSPPRVLTAPSLKPLRCEV